MFNTILKDNFALHGSEESDFRAANAFMEGTTKELTVAGYEIKFLSYCPLPSQQREDETPFYVLSSDKVSAFLEGEKLTIGRIQNKFFGSDEYLEEIKKTSGLCCLIGNKLFEISELALKTFTLRAEVKGDMTIGRSNLIRDLHIADAIFTKNEKIHLVYREEEVNGVTVRKIFAGLGGAYKLIPQTILTKAIDKITDEGTVGKANVTCWDIDHLYSTALVSLPEIGEEIADEYKIPAEIVPGLYISTSDVGLSSIIIRGIYRRGNSYCVTDEVMMKHAGMITPEDILEKADETIFKNIRKLPEVLAELMGREVIDYSKTDLTSTAGAEKNYKAVADVLKKEVQKVCAEAKVSGKKRDQLLEAMCSEINTDIHYTLYDIAVDFIGIPDRIAGLDKDTITRLRKACGQTPFRLSKVKNISAVTEEEEVVLLTA
nr:hypothetical protein [uncultured Butyrivibrio sp.]